MAINPVPSPKADRDTLRSRLSELQGKLRAAEADKKSRMNNIVALCRSERRAMRQELQNKRAQALQQIEHEIAALRASARHLRLSRLAEVRKAADSDIAAARAAIAVERAHQDELRRIAHEHRRRRAEVHRLHEVAAKSGELHTALLGPFAGLVQRVGAKAKPVPGESRAEAVLRYAQTHPDEAHAAVEPRVEQTIKETREEIAKTKGALKTAPKPPKRPALRRPVAVPSPATSPMAPAVSPLAIRPIYLSEQRGSAAAAAKPAAGAKTAKTSVVAPSKTPPARRPGQLPRGGPGIPLEVLLRERDGLARKTPRPSAPPAAPAATRTKRTTRTMAAKKPKKKGASPPPASPPPPAPLQQAGVPAMPAANEAPARKTVKAPEVRDTAALAKLIRQDIQSAVGTCRLPGAKYSVTTEKYSMGSSITVVASKLPFPVLNDKAFTLTKFGAEFDREHFRSRFTPEAESLQQKLEEIVGAYHWDRSDRTTDDHHERFHKDIRLDDRGEMDRIREKLKAGKARDGDDKSPFVWREPPGGMLDAGWYASDDARGRRGPFDTQAQAENS